MVFRKNNFWLILIILFSAFLSSASIDAKTKKKVVTRDINKVRSEQTATKKAIKETSEKLEKNVKETRKQLAEFNTLSVEIEEKRKEISELQRRADILAAEIVKKQDSIEVNKHNLKVLRDNYISTLRRMQEAPASLSKVSFIFTSDSFEEAWRRLRYINQFGQWRSIKTEEINNATALLDKQKKLLTADYATHTAMLGQVNVARKELELKQQKTDQVVKELKKEEGSLKAVLKENEKKAQSLDKELDRLISEEQARQEKISKEAQKKEAKGKAGSKKSNRKNPTPSPKSNQSPGPKTPKESPTENNETNVSDRKLTGGFESNKGKLLFPVIGRYKIVRGFGLQKHPELSNIETNNSGIDIEVSPSTHVRAVFDGTVSAIFIQPGYNTIVMLRHGSYITIYAGLTGVTVRKGDKVKVGQQLGVVAADVENDNRAILHFEIRNERQKLNPLNWVSRR